MLFPGVFERWQGKAHGPRVQAKAVSYISEKLEAYKSFADVLDHSSPTLTELFSSVPLHVQQTSL